MNNGAVEERHKLLDISKTACRFTIDITLTVEQYQIFIADVINITITVQMSLTLSRMNAYSIPFFHAW